MKHTVCTDSMRGFLSYECRSHAFHRDSDWVPSLWCSSPCLFHSVIILNTSNEVAVPSIGLQNKKVLRYVIFRHVLNRS